MKIIRWIKNLAVALFSLCVLHPGVGRAQLVPSLTEYELNSWSFDGTNWLAPSLHNPLMSYTNVVNPTNWDGNALLVDTNTVAWLQESIVSGSQTNMTFGPGGGGTIEFWFMPDWSSGTGPGDLGRFIDVGAYSSGSPSSWLSIYLNSQGTNIYFSSETNGVFTNYLTYAISWTAYQWHLVDVTYSTNESKLYLDGQLAATGAGVLYEPDNTTLTNGFFIGSDVTGEQQMRGEMDNLTTYNYAISGAVVANDYTNGWDLMNGIVVTNASSGYAAPSYGTNLYIAQISLASGYISGLASNTLSDVSYQLQYVNSLTQTNWISIGSPILGSELTNWTPLNYVAMNPDTNMFFRLQSQQSSDGSGLPDWWEIQYLGGLGVDANELDSAGDGWTIYQKYALGVNPSTFVTPPTPADLRASYNGNTGDGTVTWLPSPGPVTGYTLEKTYTAYESSPVVQDFTLSSTATNYVDSLSGESPDPYTANFSISYRLQASYAGGSSAWTASVPLQHPTVTGSIGATTNTTYLSVANVPASTATVQLLFIDFAAIQWEDDDSFNYEADIPVSDFTNGVASLPPSLQPTNDAYGYDDYYILARTISSNGVVNASTFASDLGDDDSFLSDYGWAIPLYDARRQMKDNLIFQLRAASTTEPFHFLLLGTNGSTDIGGYGNYSGEYDYPSNYVYEGLYPFQPTAIWSPYGGIFDSTLPYENNDRFYNFVFSLANVDTNGNNDTGIQYDTPYLGLQNPPSYLFLTNGMPFPNLMSTNNTRWIYYDAFGEDGHSGPGDPVDAGIAQTSSSDAGYTIAVTNNAVNWFGLPYLSALVSYAHYDDEGNYDGVYTNVIPAGGSTTFTGNDVYTVPGNNEAIYPETAQPQFELERYIFYRPISDLLPGSPLFEPTNDGAMRFTYNLITSTYSVTNDAPVMIVPVGQPIYLAGYAKLAVTNSIYSGVYAYLGQYFDQALEVDTTGDVTTNTTGVLSPYGQFVATEPGVAALTTMPDVDSGLQGTCMVYCVSLQLDKNHDGTMDTSLNGPDVTSPSSPYVFWINNNYDRWYYDADDATNYMDDVLSGGCPRTPYTPTPDFNYCNPIGDRIIPDTRDLEDFARLWVCGVTTNLVAALPPGSAITLSWGDVGNPNTNNPTIDLFQAADSDGGIGYLTNAATAMDQTNPEVADYVGRLAPGGSIQLNSTDSFGGWTGTQFIWCGVTNGSGQLTLTITDPNSNVLAQTVAYIKIVDIKQMYERWTVGDDLTNPPSTTAVLATDDGFPTGVPAFHYPPPQSTNATYILYVHGWNMEPWEKDRFAESAFKRLYWQGYQGRFGLFRWPTGNGFWGVSTIFTNLAEKDNYNSSEYNAWQSGQGLLNKLNDLNTEYPGQVYMLAHSMGNVVAGEALRLSGTNRVVNTYVASQAAISAHTYDGDTNDVPDYSFSYPPFSYGPGAPNIYGNWFSGNNGGAAAHVISFYNTNDFALQRSVWQLNQLFKPAQAVLEGSTYWDYGYNGSPYDSPPWTGFNKSLLSGMGEVYFDIYGVLTNRYEVTAYGAPSWTTALGATPGVGNLTASINLTRSQSPRIWPIDTNPNYQSMPYSEHFYHSAEFRGDNVEMQGYWSELLGTEGFGIK